MKNFLFVITILSSFALLSCNDSGTGASENEISNFNVSVSVNPSGSGSISPSAGGTYKEGKEIELHANSNDEFIFTHWSGDIDSTSDNPLSLTVDQDYNLTANFELKTYKLTINTEGEGSVSEEVLEQKSKDYEHGTVVKLTANSAEGYKFVEWQGDITGSENPAQITVDDPKEVTAVFKKKTFTISVETSGEGSVSLNPNQTEYEYETEIELTASSTGDWAFDKWQGDITGTSNPVTIVIDTNKTVTGLFKNTLFAGGSGTEANPYQISTIEQLQSVDKYLDAYFIQINNIDASITSVWNNNSGFKPIGDFNDLSTKFTGTYNGNVYKISNLTINRKEENNTGLFGYAEDSKIENVFLENVRIVGSNQTGGLVGTNEGEIQNSIVTGEVSGKSSIGGIAGLSRGKISNSHVSGDITGKTSNNTSNSVGGLVGSNNKGEITSSSTYSIIVNGRSGVGGLIGRAYLGTVKNSFSTGEVFGTYYVGGLVGETDNFSISNSYSQNSVTGTRHIGGLVGLNNENAEISYTYATGEVTGDENVGGLVGSNIAAVSNSYWDTENTTLQIGIGSGSSNNIQGLTTAEMSGTSAKTNMPNLNWSEIWVTTDNYPILFWE